MSNGVTQEYVDEVRKQVRVQAVKWLIAAVVGLLIIAAIGWWFYLKPKIDSYIQSASGLPRGAVVAFMSSQSTPCPGSNWTLFNDAQGRMIVGAGHNTTVKESGLTPKVLGKTGGSETHKLTADEIPSHVHSSGGLSINNNQDFIHRTNMRVPLTNQPMAASLPASPLSLFALNDGNPANFGAHSHKIVGRTGSYGGSGHHENMPPYIALYYCIKK